MKPIAKALEETKEVKRARNISQEFQLYGVYIADTLADQKHYSLYIKLAKTYDRSILEQALNYAKGYDSAKSKARIFMWKLKQLKEEKK